MKLTLAMLATLLVSTLTLNAASAQTPYPVQPMAYPGYAPAPYAMGSMQGAAPTTAPAPMSAQAGCTSCGQAGCNSCGPVRNGLWKSGCGSGCGGICSWLKSCITRSKPSNAPVLRKNEYPLGFPNHPYVRSPRDYFMYDGQ